MAALAVERGLLVACDPADLHRPSEQHSLAEDVFRSPDTRQQGALDAEDGQQLVVPVQRRERDEQRAGCVRRVCRVHLAAGQLPDEPAVDGAEREPVGRVFSQEPLELRRREVRIRNEPRPLADQRGVQLPAARGGPPVLPDDRRCDCSAGGAVPEHRRLTLIRDRNRVHVVEPRSLRRREHALPDLLGVVLDPAGLREVLRQLGIAAANHVQLIVDDEAGRSGRSLVDREDHECVSMNASVRRQASSDASANASCLRSKKL